MFLLNPGLSLLIMSVRCLLAVLMAGNSSVLKSVSLVSMLFVNALKTCCVVVSLGAFGWRC